MNETKTRLECQIHSLVTTSMPYELFNWTGHIRMRLKRALKRRWNYAMSVLRNSSSRDVQLRAEVLSIDPHSLQAGDIVKIRSREEIIGTLDKWNQSRGCVFMEEMWKYCGSVQRVLKRVRKFLDERDYRVRKCSGIVILDGITCEGTKDFGECDRSCFFFWREEWLEKLDQEQ